jgi:hypothetical protein
MDKKEINQKKNLENYRNSFMNVLYPLERLPSKIFFRPINVTINSFRLPVKPIDICYEKETSFDIETIKLMKLDASYSTT